MNTFEYRIVEVPVEAEDGQPSAPPLFMPQRGVSGHMDGISSKLHWRDALPAPAPNMEMAALYVSALQKFDNMTSPGRVVWSSV